MNKNIRFIVAGLLTATMVFAPVAGIAQDKPDKPKAPAAGNAPEKPASVARAIPMRGTVAAVDKDAKTVTVGERVFHVNAETKVMKGNDAATLAEVKVGDVIGGNYTKGDDGKLTAKMIRFGAKPSPAEPTDKKAKAAEKANPNAE